MGPRFQSSVEPLDRGSVSVRFRPTQSCISRRVEPWECLGTQGLTRFSRRPYFQRRAREARRRPDEEAQEK